MGVFALIVVVVGVLALSIWNLVLTRKLSGIEGELTKDSKELQGLSPLARNKCIWRVDSSW